jgi:hypothetical protein
MLAGTAEGLGGNDVEVIEVDGAIAERIARTLLTTTTAMGILGAI